MGSGAVHISFRTHKFAAIARRVFVLWDRFRVGKRHPEPMPEPAPIGCVDQLPLP